MKKSNNVFRSIFSAAILTAWIALMSIIAHAAQPFELHLLDVGQGQSVLIEADGHYMLIDGGGRSSSSFVVSYLKQQGIDHLDLIAVSHYDEDHMSGLIGALSVFPDDELLLPSYEGEGSLYQSFFSAAISNGASIQFPQMGDTYQLGGATVEVVGPARFDYELENDRSLAFRISYGDLTCLICGDTEQTSEQDMVSSRENLSADVYVVNHHGSKTSSTDAFLDAVSPSYALISCGLDNSYGHPAQEVLERFQNRSISMYRTDLQGTVVLYSDGSSYWFSQEACQDWTPGIYKPQTREMPAPGGAGMPNDSLIETEDPAAPAGTYRYVCNTNTMKFHYPDCSSVTQMKEKNRMYTGLSREELISDGYEPCGNCRP